MSEQELQAQIDQLVAADDKQALEQFILDHFAEFSEEDQKDFFFGIFTEALDRIGGEARIIQLQEQGSSMLKQLAAYREAVAAEGEVNTTNA